MKQQKKGRTARRIAALLTVLLLPVNSIAYAAGTANVSVDGKAADSSMVVTLPKGSAVAFSLRLTDEGAFGKGYTCGNSSVGQTGTVQRIDGKDAVYAIKAVGEPGESAGLYIDGEKVLEIQIAKGAACPSCKSEDGCYVNVDIGDWKADGTERDCPHYGYGSDTREAQPVYDVYTCAKCGNTSKIITASAYRWECHGTRG